MDRWKKIVFENESDRNVKKPSEYRYLTLVRYTLATLNAWPSKDPRRSKYIALLNYILLIFIVVCWISVFMFARVNSDKLDFYELGHTYIELFMTTVCISRTIIALPGDTKYREVGSLFLNKMHLFYYKEVSKFAHQTHKQIHFICHVFTLYLLSQALLGLILFNAVPMWINYASGNFKHKVLQNSTYEYSIYFYLPDYFDTNRDAYIALCIVNWFISYLTSTLFCVLDLLLSLMVFHLWGHIKILLHDIESFPLPANKEIVTLDGDYVVTAEMYSEEEQKQVSKKLKQCIDYHRLIADYTQRMSNAFGPMLFIYYLFHQVCGCLLLLECSQMTPEALIRYLPLSVILCQQLIQLSVIFELIGSTSEKLKDAVYSMPWQYMNTSNRRTVCIFLVNVQEPIHVKALGMMDVGVRSMAAILKTSISYFIFLRSM